MLFIRRIRQAARVGRLRLVVSRGIASVHRLAEWLRLARFRPQPCPRAILSRQDASRHLPMSQWSAQ